MGRSKGDGMVYKRGKVWYARWVVDGKVFVKTTKSPDRKEALKKLKEWVHPFQTNSKIEMLENLQAKVRSEETKLEQREDEISNLPIEKGIDKYLSLANVSSLADGSQRTYAQLYNGFKKWCDVNKITQLKAIDSTIAEKFLSSWKSKSASRYNGTLALLIRMWNEFKRLSKHHCFKDNPWDGFKYKKHDPSYRRALTVDEFKKLMDAANEDDDMSMLFCLGFYTGLRLSDCCCLEWRSVDFTKMTIHLLPIKTKRTGKYVTLPIHNVLFQTLFAKKQTIEEGIKNGIEYDGLNLKYVIPKFYALYNFGNIERKISEVFKKAGLDTRVNVGGQMKSALSFHSLRHTFVSLSANAGVSLDIVQHLVGHMNKQMTQHYEHLSSITLQNAVNQLPSIGLKDDTGALVVEDEYTIVKVKKSLLDALGMPLERFLEQAVKSI